MDIFILAFDMADKSTSPDFMESMFPLMYEIARQHLANEIRAIKSKAR